MTRRGMFGSVSRGPHFGGGSRFIRGLRGGVSDALDPNQIAGLHTWLKADSLSLNDDDAVGNGAWTDSSGNGHDVATAVGLTYKTNVINSKPVVRWNAATDRGIINVFTALVLPVTYFFVAKFRVITGDQYLLDGTTNPPRNAVFLANGDGNPYIYAGIGFGEDGGTVTADTFFVMVIVMFGSSSFCRINQVQSANFNPGGANPDSWVLGNRFSLATGMDGDIAEFGAYSVQLSAANINALELGLKAKYAL